MFINTYFWGDVDLEELHVEVEAYSEGWLLTGWLGPYAYSWIDLDMGAPWPSAEDSREVSFDMV